MPPTDELEALQKELQALKQRTLDRVRKAGNDMRLIKESMRRIEEREKGKQRVDRIKKERARASLSCSSVKQVNLPRFFTSSGDTIFVFSYMEHLNTPFDELLRSEC